MSRRGRDERMRLGPIGAPGASGATQARSRIVRVRKGGRAYDARGAPEAPDALCILGGAMETMNMYTNEARGGWVHEEGAVAGDPRLRALSWGKGERRGEGARSCVFQHHVA